MSGYFLWVSVGILTFFLLIGFLCGLVRGLKRSSLHIIFFVLSIVVAFCITKTVTNAVLGVTITVNGEVQSINDFITQMIKDQFDLSAYGTATAFIAKLPMALLSPILFILLSLGSYIIFDIIYLIIARVAFGSKKKDFKEHKPHRWFGSLVGVVEGFLFLFILFAPLTALTKTYSEITYIAQEEAQVQMLSQEFENEIENGGEDNEGESQDNHLQTIPQMLKENLPKEIDEAIAAYNNSILGKLCGAGGLDKALFDGLSNFKLNGEKIRLRTELLNLAGTYNNFVVVYNNYIDANYVDIDLTKLKANIESFLNNGIFKTVVADTVRDAILNFKIESETPENPEEPTAPKEPTLIEDILLQLQNKEKAANEENERYITADYLKQDILKMIDIAQEIFQSNLLSDINAVTDKTTIAMMEAVGKNTVDAENLIANVFDLQIVEDIFPALSRFLKDTLKDVEDMVSVDEIADTTNAWEAEIKLLCKALNVLATNTIEVDVKKEDGSIAKENISYLAYFMAEENPEQPRPEDYNQTLFKEMVKEKTIQEEGEEPKTVIPFAQLLDSVIESKLFTPLVNMIFEELDGAIESLTGVKQQTKTDSLKETKAETISAIVKIMDFALNLQSNEDLDLAKVGKILDILKENAKAHSTDGKFDGVFNETFINLIWYMTGDSIDGRVFDVENQNEHAETIKKYLEVEADDETANPKTYSGYYAFESYEKEMQNVQEVVDFAKSLDANLKENLQSGNVEEVVSGIVNSFGEKTEAEQKELLDNVQKVIDSLTEDGEILNQTQKDAYGSDLVNKLEDFKNEQKISEDVASKIKELFGLADIQPTNP